MWKLSSQGESPNISHECMSELRHVPPILRTITRVYRNRRHSVKSFKAKIQAPYMKWRKISGATKLLSRILKILKIPSNFQNFQHFFFFFKISPLKIKIFKKPDNMLEGNGWWICVQNFKSISSKMAEIWHKTCQKQALFTSFREFTVIFLILFFDRFWCFKKCFRVIFRVLCENLT